MAFPIAPESERPLTVDDAVRRARDALVVTRLEDRQRREHIESQLRSTLVMAEASPAPHFRSVGAAIRTACAHLGAGQLEDAFLALDAASDRLR